MSKTLLYTRSDSVLLVGATGPNVLVVVTAFERRRIETARAADIAEACEKVLRAMPQVVLLFVPPASDADREALNDRAAAVGARVIDIDPQLDKDTVTELVERLIQSVFAPTDEEQSPETLHGSKVTVPPGSSPASRPTAPPHGAARDGGNATVPPGDVDGGWET